MSSINKDAPEVPEEMLKAALDYSVIPGTDWQNTVTATRRILEVGLWWLKRNPNEAKNMGIGENEQQHEECVMRTVCPGKAYTFHAVMIEEAAFPSLITGDALFWRDRMCNIVSSERNSDGYSYAGEYLGETLLGLSVSSPRGFRGIVLSSGGFHSDSMGTAGE